jgi:hypothetical protein
MVALCRLPPSPPNTAKPSDVPTQETGQHPSPSRRPDLIEREPLRLRPDLGHSDRRDRRDHRHRDEHGRKAPPVLYPQDTRYGHHRADPSRRLGDPESRRPRIRRNTSEMKICEVLPASCVKKIMPNPTASTIPSLDAMGNNKPNTPRDAYDVAGDPCVSVHAARSADRPC